MAELSSLPWALHELDHHLEQAELAHAKALFELKYEKSSFGLKRKTEFFYEQNGGEFEKKRNTQNPLLHPLFDRISRRRVYTELLRLADLSQDERMKSKMYGVAKWVWSLTQKRLLWPQEVDVHQTECKPRLVSDRDVHTSKLSLAELKRKLFEEQDRNRFSAYHKIWRSERRDYDVALRRRREHQIEIEKQFFSGDLSLDGEALCHIGHGDDLRSELRYFDLLRDEMKAMLAEERKRCLRDSPHLDLADSMYYASFGKINDFIFLNIETEIKPSFFSKIVPSFLHSWLEPNPSHPWAKLALAPRFSMCGLRSIAMALFQFGFCFRSACPREGAFFSAIQDPRAAVMQVYSWLFASLMLNPIFYAKQLGFSKDESKRACRETSRMFVSLFALTEMALEGNKKEAAPSFPFPYGSLVALARAFLLGETVRELFDEDWFRNPRTSLFLMSKIHEEAGKICSHRVEKEGLQKDEAELPRVARFFESHYASL